MKRATWQRYKSVRIVRNDHAGLRDYPGAKNAPGVWQTIINNIQPHDTFVECFAGSAAVTRHKLPAMATIVIESDAAVHRQLVETFRPWGGSTLIERFAIADVGQHECQLGSVRLVRGCAVKWLQANKGSLNARTVVYCDPPYLDSTRAVPGRRYYDHEFGCVADHAELLDVLRFLECPVLISGRRSKLYDTFLRDWRRVDYQTRNHGHTVTESLWCSFPEPEALHDWRYLGANFRERERIKRKVARWRRRLAEMPILERRLLSAALVRADDAS